LQQQHSDKGAYLHNRDAFKYHNISLHVFLSIELTNLYDVTSINPPLYRSYTLLASKGFGLMPGQALEEKKTKKMVYLNTKCNIIIHYWKPT